MFYLFLLIWRQFKDNYSANITFGHDKYEQTCSSKHYLSPSNGKRKHIVICYFLSLLFCWHEVDLNYDHDLFLTFTLRRFYILGN